jgi:Zn-dependent M28 family amino/carboxypeptidase
MRKQNILAGALALTVAMPALAFAADPTFRPEAMQAHVSFLADDLLEGRGTGARGHEIAARYIEAQFKALGLKPAGDNGSWQQRFALQEASLGEAGAALTITGPSGAKRYVNGDQVIMFASAVDAQEDFSAPLVFAGYGLDAAREGFDDYKGVDAKGKIVVVLDGMPAGTPSEIGAHLASEKGAMAQAHGAVGVITITTKAGEAHRPFAVLKPYVGRPRMTWVEASGRPHQDAPAIKLTAITSPVSAAALFEGAKKNWDKVMTEAAVKGAKPKGFALKTSVRLQRASTWRKITTPNVLGYLEGSDPKLKDEVVVMMAHSDHLGITPGEGDTINNGAMDNAAGTAALLEVARAFANAPEKPRRSILFIATAAEEQGLLGAEYFAANPTVPLSRVAALVNVDMPVLTYDFIDVVAFGADHSTLGPVVAEVAKSEGLTLGPDPFPEEGVFTRSDHYPLVKAGVPSVMLATGFGNGGDKAWGEFFAKRYHKPNDDLTQAINWQAGARFAETNYRVTAALANADERPRWYAGDVFGDLFAKDAPKAAKPK